MYVFRRTVETSGEMDVVIPLAVELKEIAKKEAGIDVTVWAGGLGFRNGTLVFSVPYASVADRAVATGKLAMSKAFADGNRKLYPHVRDIAPDEMAQYIKGGSVAGSVPVGAVVSLIESQLAQGADWMKTLEWALSVAELSDKITGTTHNVAYVVYGQLGRLITMAGHADGAAAAAAREAMVAHPEWMPKFLEGGQFAAAGSVESRLMTKIL